MYFSRVNQEIKENYCKKNLRNVKEKIILPILLNAPFTV